MSDTNSEPTYIEQGLKPFLAILWSLFFAVQLYRRSSS